MTDPRPPVGTRAPPPGHSETAGTACRLLRAPLLTPTPPPPSLAQVRDPWAQAAGLLSSTSHVQATAAETRVFPTPLVLQSPGLPLPGSGPGLLCMDMGEKTCFPITLSPGVQPARTRPGVRKHRHQCPGPHQPPREPRGRARARQPGHHLRAQRCLPAPRGEDRWLGRCLQRAVPCPHPPRLPQRALALAGCAVWGAGFGGWRANA